ncbi:MAG: PilN domain-containing protein [Sedimentisphaerales bacterium]|nr:PilN domain-containing protein [Sedimentisphaerales bacterium]
MKGLGQRQIDFVPDWYRAELARRACLRRQYLALAVLFLAMVIWNAFSMRSISSASAQLFLNRPMARAAEQVRAEFDRLVSQIATSRQALQRLDGLAKGPQPAALLSELSSIIGPDVLAQGLILQITDEGPVLLLKAVARDGQALANLMEDLQRSPYLSDVRLSYWRHGDLDNWPLEFEVRCRPVVGSCGEDRDLGVCDE